MMKSVMRENYDEFIFCFVFDFLVIYDELVAIMFVINRNLFNLINNNENYNGL